MQYTPLKNTDIQPQDNMVPEDHIINLHYHKNPKYVVSQQECKI
jgi:hypothetical protein